MTELLTCERTETMITQLKRTIRHDYANMCAAMDPNAKNNPRPTEMHIYAPTMGTGTFVRKDAKNQLTDKVFIIVRTDTGYYYCSNRPGFDQVRECREEGRCFRTHTSTPSLATARFSRVPILSCPRSKIINTHRSHAILR